MIGLNRRRVMGGEKLPYDAEIKYLGFAQKCSVDTGIMPSTNYKYYWKYLWTNKTNWVYPFTDNGSKGNWFIFGGVEVSDKTQVHLKSDANLQGRNLNINTLYEGSFMHNGNDMEVRLNNTLVVSLTYIDFQATSTLKISGAQDIVINIFVINIYGFSIYNENDVLILDLIPVRVGTTGYMYDKVSGQLFGNSGTGEFILGPDVNSDNS